MTPAGIRDARTNTVRSDDGTVIAYHSLGHGPGLVVVGGVLSEGSDYMALAGALARGFEVHVMERRGRPGSGPQRPDHSLDDECADLVAVTAATGSAAVFGHSFGGLVVLETARRRPIFDEMFVYEPGVPIRGQLRADWLDDYQRRLERGDRRGAFAHMVKSAGLAPGPVALVPVWYVRLVLRIGFTGSGPAGGRPRARRQPTWLADASMGPVESAGYQPRPRPWPPCWLWLCPWPWPPWPCPWLMPCPWPPWPLWPCP